MGLILFKIQKKKKSKKSYTFKNQVLIINFFLIQKNPKMVFNNFFFQFLWILNIFNSLRNSKIKKKLYRKIIRPPDVQQCHVPWKLHLSTIILTLRLRLTVTFFCGKVSLQPHFIVLSNPPIMKHRLLVPWGLLSHFKIGYG